MAPLPGHISNHVPRSPAGVSAAAQASRRPADGGIVPLGRQKPFCHPGELIGAGLSFFPSPSFRSSTSSGFRISSSLRLIPRARAIASMRGGLPPFQTTNTWQPMLRRLGHSTAPYRGSPDNVLPRCLVCQRFGSARSRDGITAP
jgi:hypothetical protein